MESELQWRNCLEHDIDPFYNDEIFNIIKELNISKIAKYTSLICNLIEQINLSGPRNIIYKQESVNYKVLSLECRKELISRLNEKHIKIFKMINEISYISMNESLSEEGRNIVDLGIKYLELNKCIYYTYNGLNVINNEYTGLKRDTYSYFVRMSIIIYYRVFDKLGLYLNNRLGFGLSDKYLKK
ncbi:hypothetical protein IRP63_12200 [Clostridium botulinum]|nr:hypothetical protein [Clostridium botulinum]QPW57571.1 hypothetical protein IRP63_12200 [Clostridium botulinum]